jgi:2-hydroxy-6-oxonona-2,4-dienedioate hydrolase
MKRFKRILKWTAAIVTLLLVTACVLPYCISIAQPAPPQKPFDNSQFATLDGVRIHYRVWPPATLPSRGNVLFVHGFCGSTFSWRKNIDALIQSGYRVAAIDLPPFGYSERRPGIDHSSPARAKLCWTLIDTLDGKDGADQKWFTGGHSMGGGVIGAMAAQHPEKIAGLIFVDGGLNMGGRGNRESVGTKLYRLAINTPPVRRWVEVVAKYRLFKPGHIRELMSGAYSQPADDEAVNGYLAPLKVPGTASGILDMFSSQRGAPVDEKNIEKLPALIIWGDDDRWIPIRAGESLHQRLAGSTFEKLVGAGHCSMETHADAFNSAALAFMNAHATPPELPVTSAISQ